MAPEKNIIIVGGGFAGTSFAKACRGRLPSGYRLIMVSEESYTTFNPMLPEAVGASIFPEQLVAPLREVLDVRHAASRSQFVMGRVERVDWPRRELRCASLAGETILAFEHLVMAFGNRARLDLIPGMAEHALPLKTVGDAMHIRNRVLQRLARLELEDDPALRQRLGHFVVIGGGFSGVEVAGELIDCLRSILPFYPRVKASEVGVSVVQNIDRLLPELPPVLGMRALQSLRSRGVQVLLNLSAKAVSAEGVALTDGSTIAASTVISTIGTRPNALSQHLATTLGVEVVRGRMVTQPDGQIPSRPGLWAIGDCAQIHNARDDTAAPPTAQFAIQEGKLAARNLLAVLAQQPTKPLNYQSRGMMAAMGHQRGVALVMGVTFSGLPAWLMWRAYYLSQMPTFGRKLRIFVEWTWGMVFSADITHLRFTRSEDQAE